MSETSRSVLEVPGNCRRAAARRGRPSRAPGASRKYHQESFVNVAQTSGLPYRRLAVGWCWASQRAPELATARRSQTCDTADRRSALRWYFQDAPGYEATTSFTTSTIHATGGFGLVLADPPFNVNAVDKERLKDMVGANDRFSLRPAAARTTPIDTSRFLTPRSRPCPQRFGWRSHQTCQCTGKR